MRNLVLGSALLLVASALTFAQSEPRVAMIDAGRLEGSAGVQRFRDALQLTLAARPCHHRCGRMKEAIDVLEKEIAERKCANQPLGDREARLQESRNEYDALLALDKERIERNKATYIKPVVEDMRELAKKFAAERNYAVLVDKSGLIFPSAVIVGEPVVPDVTLEFIKYCNTEFERRKTEKDK